MIGMHVNMPKGEVDDGVKLWFSELDRGIKLREKEARRWTANEEFEDMRQWDGEAGEGDEVSVNKVGSLIRTMRARIGFNDPRAKLTPKTHESAQPVPVPVAGAGGMAGPEAREVSRVKVREAMLNDILAAPLSGTQAVNSRLVKSGLLAVGFLKSGYRPAFATDPEPDAEQEIRIREDGTLDIDDFVRNPITGDLEVDENGRLIDRSRIPLYEDFFISWVPYRNMIIDPDGGNDWSDHRWVAEEWVRPLDEVKSDPLFKNTSDLKCTGYRKDGEDGKVEWLVGDSGWGEADDGDEIKRAAKVVRGFEIYDLVNGRKIVLADGHGKYLQDIPTPAGITDHPYSDYRPNEVLGKFYPRPLASDVVPINQWYNLARQKELRAMDRSNRKVFIRRGALTIENMDDFASDEDLKLIEVDTRGHQDMSTAIIPYAPPPVSESIYRSADTIARDFDEVAGISEAGRGRNSGGTATETSVMEQYSGSRIDFDRKVLAECWRRAIKKLNDSIDANMTLPRAVMIQGSDGMTFSGLVDRDMIAGDFDVDVDVDDMAPVNSAVQGAQMVQLMQVAGQSPWLFADQVLASEMCKQFGVRNIRFAEKLAEMAQMQMAMLAAPKAPAPSPEAPPPASEADAISQAAAGMQAPNMQGAT